MKNTIYTLISILILIGFSSCSSYYYSRLNTTDNQVLKDNNGDFIIENDSVHIKYCFYGENAPINISIFNKTDRPLYVDWQKSAIIINDVATSYKGQQVPLSGNSQSYSTNYMYFNSSSGSFSGNMTLPQGIDFIPPKSKIEHCSLRLSNLDFDQIANENYTKQDFCKASGEVVKIKSAHFEEDDSPLYFRSYLTLYYPVEDEKLKPMVSQQDFYISELIKAGDISPSNWDANVSKRGDFFYVKKTRGATAGAIAATIIVGAAAGAVDAAVTNYNNK